MSPGENASRSRPSRNKILILSKPGLVYMMPLAYFLLMSPTTQCVYALETNDVIIVVHSPLWNEFDGPRTCHTNTSVKTTRHRERGTGEERGETSRRRCGPNGIDGMIRSLPGAPALASVAVAVGRASSSSGVCPLRGDLSPCRWKMSSAAGSLVTVEGQGGEVVGERKRPRRRTRGCCV